MSHVADETFNNAAHAMSDDLLSHPKLGDSSFIEVIAADKVRVLIHVADVAGIDPKRVRTSQNSNVEVSGCVISRFSSQYGIWCIQPPEEVHRLLEHAGAKIARSAL